MIRFFSLLILVVFLQPAWAVGGESYTLKKGDTLYRISKEFDVPVAVLQLYNEIENPQSLREGTRIQLPERYTVKKGDTLYGICRQRGVGLEELRRLNGMGGLETLKVGQTLFLPASPVVQESTKPSGGNSVDVDPGSLIWPHPGRREQLKGRITGTLIHGQAGDAVISISSGQVVWVGPYRGFSRVVLIQAENGYTYVYAGNEEALVSVGDRVATGTEIGRLGKNVHQGVPQLYFLVYRNGQPVDPSLAPRS